MGGKIHYVNEYLLKLLMLHEITSEFMLKCEIIFQIYFSVLSEVLAKFHCNLFHKMGKKFFLIYTKVFRLFLDFFSMFLYSVIKKNAFSSQFDFAT